LLLAPLSPFDIVPSMILVPPELGNACESGPLTKLT